MWDRPLFLSADPFELWGFPIYLRMKEYQERNTKQTRKIKD